MLIAACSVRMDSLGAPLDQPSVRAEVVTSPIRSTAIGLEPEPPPLLPAALALETLINWRNASGMPSLSPCSVIELLPRVPPTRDFRTSKRVPDG